MPLPIQRRLQLIQSVTNEDFLRKDVLIPLFRNMGKFEMVLDNHGPNEKGTDIVLVERTVFDRYRYTSVILKTTPINNATSTRKDRETAANVSQQIALAIQNGHHCSITNREVSFNTIIIITNQVISGTGRETLTQTAKLFGTHDIQYLQGEDLLKLVDEHLPKFYFYQSGVHARIASALQAKCEHLSDLQNLPQFSVQERALIDVFVKPHLRYIESKYVEGRQKNQIVVKTPDQILPKSNRVLIIGEAGSGKSIILREAVLSLLSKNTRDAKSKLPFLVKAHDLAKANTIDFTIAVNNTICNYYSVDDFELDLVRHDSEVALLIDGLDEIIDLQQREQLKKRIVEFGDNNPDIQIIVTSRRTQDIIDMTSMPIYQRWEILPFDFHQVRDFINKWFANHDDSRHRLLAALEDHQLLSRLPSTPLVLTLLAILFDSDDYREIPANLAELYRMFLDLLLGKWNLDRRVENMHNANIREYLATEIAQEMHRKHLISITRDTFEQIIGVVEQERGIRLDANVLINDFTEQSALLVVNDKNELEFRHLSFQEFLVALAIYKHPDGEKIEFLVNNFEQSWWTKVLYFYCGLRQDTPDIISGVVARLSQITIPRRMNGVFELGYLIQAAYLTPIDVRMENVRTSLCEFCNCISVLEEIKIDNINIPEGMVYFAFVFALSMHFSSRMLQEHYHKLFDQILEQETHDNSSAFVALSLAIFIAQNNDFTALTRVYNLAKKDPKQLLSLGFIGDILLKDLSPDEKRRTDVQEFKSTLNKIHKWFKSHSDITRRLLDTPKAMLSEDVDT